jgi:hypothetical protein
LALFGFVILGLASNRQGQRQQVIVFVIALSVALIQFVLPRYL